MHVRALVQPLIQVPGCRCRQAVNGAAACDAANLPRISYKEG